MEPPEKGAAPPVIEGQGATLTRSITDGEPLFPARLAGQAGVPFIRSLEDLPDLGLTTEEGAAFHSFIMEGTSAPGQDSGG